MTWRTGFTLTPGWSLLSLYKMNKILLAGPDPAWSEDAEPRHLFRKVPTRMPLAPTSPAHFFFLLIPPLSSHRWAPASPQTAHLTHSLRPPAKACPPSPLTLPPTLQCANSFLRASSRGHSHFRGAEPAGGEGRPTAHISMATKHTLLPGAC